MKVMYIGYVWPEPNSSAAGWRTLSLLDSFIQRGDDVVFACAAAHSSHAADLAALGIRAQSIALNCSSFDEFIEQEQPDIVIFDRFVCEEQFGWRVRTVVPNALRIIDTQDLHCLRDARQRYCKALPAAAIAGANNIAATALDLNSDIAKRELAAIWRSDLSLIISEPEISLLKDYFGVDEALLQYFPLLSQGRPEDLPGFSDREHCVVIGNFRHAPNWDALQVLRNTLWPQIRRGLPAVECHVYGAYPPPKAQQLHSEKLGFLIKGWADDAGLVMRNARLNLAPLRFGAGQKGKLLEAMEQGTPSMTTAIGAEGMAGGLPWGGEVLALEAFSAAVVALYGNEPAWQQAQQNGFQVLAHGFDPAPHRAALAARVSILLKDREQARRNNFIGEMLWHHSLRSQQYMSQWIEAKNKVKT